MFAILLVVGFFFQAIGGLIAERVGVRLSLIFGASMAGLQVSPSSPAAAAAAAADAGWWWSWWSWWSWSCLCGRWKTRSALVLCQARVSLLIPRPTLVALYLADPWVPPVRRC